MPSDGRFIVVRTTLLDYPGKVAATVFLPGCHLRCPYCHNPDLASGIMDDGAPWDDERSFTGFLRRRAPYLGGVVFSGGEALLHPLLFKLMRLVKTSGLRVKLDTAGLLPDALGTLLEAGLIDYIAMDLKTLPGRYGELGWNGTGDRSAVVLLNRTINLLKGSGVDYEIRTTVVPPLVNPQVLVELAEMVNEVPRWVWQTYRKGKTLNPDWGDISAPDEEDLHVLLGKMNPEPAVVIR